MSNKQLAAFARYEDVAARFWPKVDKSNSCWNWMGAKRSLEGYGQIKVKGKRRVASRIAYELTFGEIPNGMLVCHRCDNPQCVRPEHLFLGTTEDNHRDRARKMRNGEYKLTLTQVKEIRQRYKAFDRANGARALGREFGVEHSTICNIVHGRKWKWTHEIALSNALTKSKEVQGV